MALDPLIMEVHQKRAVKFLLVSWARILIVSSFLAEALYTYSHWHLQRSSLSMTWHCGYLVAGIFISLLATAQLIASLLIVVNRQIRVATGILWLAAHLHMAATPALWSLPKYMELCGIISALLLIMLKSQRHAVVAFMLITYLNCKELERFLWHILYKYVLKLLLVLIMVGFRLKLSAGLLIALMAIHCLDTHVWRKDAFVDYIISTGDVRRFHFWQKVSVAGGLVLTTVNRRNRHLTL
ncbi:surfeit locus protein 4 isoform X2 [Drosophila subpulchrella]|nr:surfeit locus protein 4 isoform X2 [Drosophila subpulchrella]XP_037730463.1 surfeit locus protein 4 isoform X2 [Drosophila subpulchrella]